MEIKYAIVSSDESEYLDYWPIISKAWQKLGIEPVLVKIQSNINECILSIDNGFLIIKLPLIPNIKSSLQAQIGRIWAYKILDANCIISDIDMYPISESYFKDTVKQYNNDQIISYCSDAAKRFDGNHPMCYVLANAEVMSKLISQTTWEDFVKDLAEAGGQGWSTDQWYLTTLLDSYNQTISLQRGWNSAGCADNRLDRIGWVYNKDEIKNFYDAHLPKPYKSNENKIKEFRDLL
jgi:hypothetical protein